MTQHPHTPPPRPPPPSSSGCLAAVMILGGSALLLPGFCALTFVGSDLKRALTDPTGLVVAIVCLAAAAGGVALIWRALKLY